MLAISGISLSGSFGEIFGGRALVHPIDLAWRRGKITLMEEVKSVVDHEEGNLPVDDQKAEGERASINAAERLFASRFIFRSEPLPDRGVDGSIELRRLLAGQWRATGKRAWCQLKHTSVPQRLADGSVSYRIDTKNINYLRNYPCPFYLLYVWPSDEMLFHWHRDVMNQLNQERPSWNEQKEVNIRFSRRVDQSLLGEIEIEIDSYAGQVAQLDDGPKFIRFLRPERACQLLEPDRVFIGRYDERRLLELRMGRGRIVTITGEPDAGKRELVRQALSDGATLEYLQRSLDGPLALLVLDVGMRLEPRLLRGIAWAIGLQKSLNIESDEASSRARARATLIAESLPARVQGQRLLALIENAERCLDDPKERSDFDEFLASQPFRSGCALIVTPLGAPPDGKGSRVCAPEMRVGPLPPGDAVTLLECLGVEHSLSSSVVGQAIVLPELLLPGVIRRAVSTFTVRVADGQVPKTPATLLDELIDAREYVVTKVLGGLGGYDQLRLSDASPGPLGALFAVSFLGRQAIKAAELSASGLSETVLEKLCRVGWIEASGEDAYRLTGTGYRSLRKAFQQSVSDAASRNYVLGIVSEILHQFVGTIGPRLAEEEFDEFSQTLEEAIAWVRDIGLEETPLVAVLTESLLPYVVEDLFFPIPPERVPATRDQLRTIGRPDSLAHAAAELALAIRSEVDANEFLSRLREAVSVAAKTPQLQAIHIRVLDFSAFMGQRRYHRAREILQVRRNLLDRMLVLHADEAADVALLKWSASWVLNTAATAAIIGEIDMARKSAEAARVAVARLPQPRTAHGMSDHLWLTSRLAQIEGRLLVDSQARLEKLHEAADTAFGALASTPRNPRWVRFALRAKQRFAEELRTDDQRDQLLEDVEGRLATIFGDHTIWPLALKAQLMALARDTASLNADPERRVRLVRRFLDRFELAGDDAKSLACLGDSRPLLVLARSYAFLANCHDDLNELTPASEYRGEALQLTQEALDSAPSAAGWELYLRLLDQEGASSPEAAWHTDPLSNRQFAIGANLRKSIDAARIFLSNVLSWGADEGRLALWCFQRELMSHGSLERCAINLQDPAKPWDGLPHEAKRQVLRRLHRGRQNALRAIEARTGPFLELYLLRIWHEAQLQRLLAIYGNHIPETRAVLQQFESAKRLWPDSYTLLKEEGRFHRYIWNYPSAVEALRRAVVMMPSGYERREAMVDLAEVLLIAAAHCGELELSDKTIVDGATLVAEASTLLAELRGFTHVSREVAMLWDRAELEAGSGSSLNWGAIDEAFDTVVGGVDAYPTTLVSNLDHLLATQPNFPEHFADLVVTNFTSPEILRHLGWLYLRSVDLEMSRDPALDCWKAYAAFQACRILEMSWSRKESATTSYQRGRTILTAAKATGKLMPFQAYCEGKRNLVHLAEVLFNRTVSLTVGLFHLEARRRHSEATRLQQILDSNME